MKIRTKADVLLLVATFFWGATFVVVKGAMSDASPISFLTLRFALASLLLLALGWRGQIDRKVILPGIILGLLLFVGFVFQTWGLLYTTPSKAAFITGSCVIWVPAILWLRGIRLRPATVAGATSGLLGLYCLIFPSSLVAVNRGDVLNLLGAIAFAFHIVLVGTYTRRFPFRQLVQIQILVVAVLSMLSLPFDSQRHLEWTVQLVLALLATAVLATVVAFTVQNWAQQYTPSSHAAIIFTLEPVFAALMSWVVTGEHLGGRGVLGAVLILGGMIASEFWGGRSPSPPTG